MNSYKIEIDESELQLLAFLEMPIIGYATDSIADDFPSSVYLSTQEQQLKFTSKSEDLEHHFECFGLKIHKIDKQKSTVKSTEYWGREGNQVELMIRREALYNKTDVKDNTFGNNPSVQKVIAPGDDCSDADAICKVTAGVCITSSNGKKLLIYADTFPFCIRVELDQQNVSKELSKFKLMSLEEYRRCT